MQKRLVEITEKGVNIDGNKVPVGTKMEIGEHMPSSLVNKCRVIEHGTVFVVNPKADEPVMQDAAQEDEPASNDDVATDEPEQEQPQLSERDALKAKADALGINYAKNIPTEKLSEIIASHEAE